MTGRIQVGRALHRHCKVVIVSLSVMPSLFLCAYDHAYAQSAAAKPLISEATKQAGARGIDQTTEQKVEQLTSTMGKVQAEMEANHKVLIELQKQLQSLRQQMAMEKSTGTTSKDGTMPSATGLAEGAAPTTSTIASTSLEELREHQAMDASQIATLEQSKVESQSKYPVTVSGLLLFNGFVNTRQVDVAAAPAYAISAQGTTGFSIRQTILGLDARGPHVLGATSRADVRVDFFGNDVQSGYSAGALRLRTAHIELKWPETALFFALDRSILEPNAPNSLLAIGQPELAWTGNLWTWNPQVGLSRQFQMAGTARIQAQVALIDVADPRLPGTMSKGPTINMTERSRWPGTEARVAILGGTEGAGPSLGIGAYFSPHRTVDNIRFNAWAGTLDARLPLFKYFVFTANAYRGQGLGGLGGGGYVDYYYEFAANKEQTRALKDLGGWTQLTAKAGQRLEANAGYGIDNPFAREIHLSITTPGNSYYPGLARNRALFTNVIYRPSAYLLFSLEYRRFWSNYASGSTAISDTIGLGAGYRF